MSRFEDEIKKKLQDNNWDTEPTGWKAMQQKLDAQPPLSDFEQAINDKIESENIEYNEAHWEDFTNKHNNLNSFEKALAEKISSGTASNGGANWSAMQNALNNARLTPFEKAFKRVLSLSKVAYNPTNWTAIENSLNAAKNRKIFYKAAASVLLLLGIGFGMSEYVQPQNKKISSFLYLDSLDSKALPSTESTKKISDKATKNVNSIGSDYLNEKDENKLKELTIPAKTAIIKTGLSTNESIDRNSVQINKKETGYQDNSNKWQIIQLNKLAPELCSPLEFLPEKVKPISPSNQKATIHPAATVWFNMWDNPVYTGYFGKQYASLNYENNWSWSDQDGNLQGAFNLNQPLSSIAAYEHRVNKTISLGGFVQYTLNNNWNHRTINLSASYSKEILKGFNFRAGANATLNNNNIAVNRLTLREQALNSNFIFTTELGSIKAEQSYDINYDIGALLENQWFYISYLGENIATRDLTGHQEYLKAHQLQFAVHAPVISKFKSSAMLQYKKELFNQYSPAIGVTYNDNLFVFAEYSNLNSSTLTMGYLYKNKLRIQGTFNLNQPNESAQIQQTRLNQFIERKGFINFRLNYLIK